MTLTITFTVPYSIKSADNRLDKARQQAVDNASSSSDISGFTKSTREISGNRVVWTLHGVSLSDMSETTKQEFIDAVRNNLPGAGYFSFTDE